LPKVSEGKLRYLTPGEFKTMLSAAPEWMRAPLAFAVFTGCRRGELLGLRWGDVNFQTRQIFLRETKTGEIRFVPLNQPSLKVLNSLPRKKDDLVFSGVEAVRLSVETRRLFKRLGIQDASFHSLRHTAASWLAMRGAPLYSVGAILGHKTPRMTQRYAHLSPEYLQGTVALLDDQKLLE
jgi:integrase